MLQGLDIEHKIGSKFRGILENIGCSALHAN